MSFVLRYPTRDTSVWIVHRLGSLWTLSMKGCAGSHETARAFCSHYALWAACCDPWGHQYVAQRWDHSQKVPSGYAASGFSWWLYLWRLLRKMSISDMLWGQETKLMPFSRIWRTIPDGNGYGKTQDSYNLSGTRITQQLYIDRILSQCLHQQGWECNFNTPRIQCTTSLVLRDFGMIWDQSMVKVWLGQYASCLRYNRATPCWIRTGGTICWRPTSKITDDLQKYPYTLRSNGSHHRQDIEDTRNPGLQDRSR